MPSAAQLREAIRATLNADESTLVRALCERTRLDASGRAHITGDAAALVARLRADSSPTVMESFLSEYGLSTREGVALMCLAEALLRVPDAGTMDELIEDKIVASAWSQHLGHSSSPLVNASTWALMLTGKVLDDADPGLAGVLRGLVRRLGEGVIRGAVGQVMREMGRQFVLGRSIAEASERADAWQQRGYTFSYDMLGEAARTEADARRYQLAYATAIAALAPSCSAGSVRGNPGISVKLSALHPRYEYAQASRVMAELTPRVRALASLARDANMGFNIDAEEADRLDLSLDVIEATLRDPSFAGWDGFGVVVQAYGKRSLALIEWLHGLAEQLDRRIMVRLVKGAYWDTEIKRAQVLGLEDFPVFTSKRHTDVAFMACARALLDHGERIYPQFATHNAHTAMAVLHMAAKDASFEFQRLHGMGERLHDLLHESHEARVRIYAPVGAHRDLLAYLVRRLLENGANSSFVHQIVDPNVSPREVAADPMAGLDGGDGPLHNPAIRRPADLYGATRVNSRGFDLSDPLAMQRLDAAREVWRQHRWHCAAHGLDGTSRQVTNPASPDDIVGEVLELPPCAAAALVQTATDAGAGWASTPAAQRAAVLRRAADAYEASAAEFFALLTREAGKTLADGVAELREAVDFLRYYASEAERLTPAARPLGPWVCISPWNFPLAIFTGQLAAALASGNSVIAKPAEATTLIAARALVCLHAAGVPEEVLQLAPGTGSGLGAALVGTPGVAGVCFTGSTATAQRIHQTIAERLSPHTPLIAETGGLNAMIVDSTALPEQAVRDVLISAFQSAGQRCSALRMLYVQEDIADAFLELLHGAMAELHCGDPWELRTDVGPVIDAAARSNIEHYVDGMAAGGRVMMRQTITRDGHFVGPATLSVSGIAELEREVFGPVLHVATFAADALDRVLDDINARGFGLTFGLHSRIDSRVQRIVDRLAVGNIYVNRNQIGAVVGSQPFGGEGLSGTGPKAGGPAYVPRFTAACAPAPYGSLPATRASDAQLRAALATLTGLEADHWRQNPERARILDQALSPRADEAVATLPDALELPGPTGESNRLTHTARAVSLCLGPGETALREQMRQVLRLGGGCVLCGDGAVELAAAAQRRGAPVVVLEQAPDAAALREVTGVDAVLCYADEAALRTLRIALAARPGAIVPLLTSPAHWPRLVLERHVCVDTTAAGGNASLLAAG